MLNPGTNKFLFTETIQFKDERSDIVFVVVVVILYIIEPPLEFFERKKISGKSFKNNCRLNYNSKTLFSSINIQIETRTDTAFFSNNFEKNISDFRNEVTIF